MQELKQEIIKTLDRENALEIFNQEKIFFHSGDYIPKYRIVELFGEQIAQWIDDNTKYQGYLVGGADYNVTGAGGKEPYLTYYSLAGFLKIVSHHNYLITLDQENQSKAKPILDQIDKARCKKLGID